ncbi:MAG: hypothetical protein V1820_00235 [archaeon]
MPDFDPVGKYAISSARMRKNLTKPSEFSPVGKGPAYPGMGPILESIEAGLDGQAVPIICLGLEQKEAYHVVMDFLKARVEKEGERPYAHAALVYGKSDKEFYDAVPISPKIAERLEADVAKVKAGVLPDLAPYEDFRKEENLIEEFISLWTTPGCSDANLIVYKDDTCPRVVEYDPGRGVSPGGFSLTHPVNEKREKVLPPVFHLLPHNGILLVNGTDNLYTWDFTEIGKAFSKRYYTDVVDGANIKVPVEFRMVVVYYGGESPLFSFPKDTKYQISALSGLVPDEKGERRAIHRWMEQIAGMQATPEAGAFFVDRIKRDAEGHIATELLLYESLVRLAAAKAKKDERDEIGKPDISGVIDGRLDSFLKLLREKPARRTCPARGKGIYMYVMRSDDGEINVGGAGEMDVLTLPSKAGGIRVTTEWNAEPYEDSALRKSGEDALMYLKHQYGEGIEYFLLEASHHGPDSLRGPSSSALMAALWECELAGLPVQPIAVTGEVNVDGTIGIIGGVNEKVDGWWRKTGKGRRKEPRIAAIPYGNLEHLRLPDEVINGCESGRFVVAGVRAVPEVVELLTGLPYKEVRARAAENVREVTERVKAERQSDLAEPATHPV